MASESRGTPTAFPLKHQKKDLVLACDLAQELKVQMPVAKAAAALYEKVGPRCWPGDVLKVHMSAVSTVAELTAQAGTCPCKSAGSDDASALRAAAVQAVGSGLGDEDMSAVIKEVLKESNQK